MRMKKFMNISCSRDGSDGSYCVKIILGGSEIVRIFA